MSMVEEQSIYIPTAHALEAIADSIVEVGQEKKIVLSIFFTLFRKKKDS